MPIIDELRSGEGGQPLELITVRYEGELPEEAVERIRSRLEDPNAPLSGHVNEDAVQGVEIVFLTVPFRSQSENLTNLKNALGDGQILVDATVPLAAAISGKATRTIGVWQGSAAQLCRLAAQGARHRRHARG